MILVKAGRIFFFVMIFSLLVAGCGEAWVNDPVEETAVEGVTAAETEEVEDIEETPTPTPRTEEELVLGGEVLKVAHIGNLTGDNAAFFTAGIRSVEDYVETVNEHGGVFGAELELVFYDTQGVTGETEAAFEEIIADDEKALVVIVHDPADAAVLAPAAEEEEVPLINLGYQPGMDINEGYVFWLGVPPEIQFAAFLQFVVQNWEDDRPEGAGEDIRVAYIGWNDGRAEVTLTDDLRAYVRELGIEIVYEATFNPTWTEDLTNEILAARRNEANVIYTDTFAFGPAVLLNDLHRAGLYEEFLVGGPAEALDTQTYGYLESPEFLNGFYAPYLMAWWSDENNLGIEAALENFEGNNRSAAEQSQGYLLGQAAMELARVGLVEALEEESLDGLDGKAVYQALAGLEDHDVLEGLVRVDFSEGRIFNQVQFRRVTDFLEFGIVEEFSALPGLGE